MQHGQLLSHPNDLVTREQLALVGTPDATRSFKPVPHIELIETLEQELKLNQITIRKEEFALRRDGATLFGVLQLAYQDTRMAWRRWVSARPITARCPYRFAPDFPSRFARIWCFAGMSSP